ncbi:MAG: TerB family tellurite resistance protein [Rhodospirillaceae bacterium]|nr:TerB family tellurite resistance protein [Rhodospirillales bacterium]
MIDLIRSLLGRPIAQGEADRLRLAVATLLVEAATLDGHFDESERACVLALLSARFDLDQGGALCLLAKAQEAANQSVQLVGMTQLVKNSFDYGQRVELLEMLWDVAYADGQIHDYEANLLRRMAGLVYVSDQDAGAARKRVVARRGRKDGIA